MTQIYTSSSGQPMQPMQTNVTIVQSFGPDPIQMRCTHCNNNIVTMVEKEVGTFAYLLGGGLCLIG